MNSNRFLKYVLAILSPALTFLLPGGGALGITLGLVLVAVALSEGADKLGKILESFYEDDETSGPEHVALPPDPSEGRGMA